MKNEKSVGLLAAVNPFHVAYSQEARMYALLGLAAVTAAYGLLQALGGAEEQGDRGRLFIVHCSLFIVAATLTLYAHNLGVFVLLALADLAALALFGPWLVGVLPGQMGFVGRGYWRCCVRDTTR